MKTAKPYTPTPGTIPHLVVQHLESLGPAAKLPTAALMEAIGHPEVKRINAYMEAAIKHGLVKTERIPNSRHLLWSLGDGRPVHSDCADTHATEDDTADLAGSVPTPNLAVASVFTLAQRAAQAMPATSAVPSVAADYSLPWHVTKERIREVAALVERIAFPGYRFHLIGKGFVGLMASFMAPCNEKGGVPVEQFTRLWILEKDYTDEQIVQTCLKLVLTSVEHEAREQFRFDGVAVFGPHMRLQDLVTSAQLTELTASGNS